jgi:hypothetical protein
LKCKIEKKNQFNKKKIKRTRIKLKKKITNCDSRMKLKINNNFIKKTRIKNKKIIFQG